MRMTDWGRENRELSQLDDDGENDKELKSFSNYEEIKYDVWQESEQYFRNNKIYTHTSSERVEKKFSYISSAIFLAFW